MIDRLPDPSIAAEHIDSLFEADAHDRPESRWVIAAVMVALVGAFGLPGGPLGVFAGLTTALIWYVGGVPYAIAAGHVLLVAVFPGGIDPVALTIVEAGFLVAVLEPAFRTDVSRRTASVVLGAVAAFGGLAWLAVRSWSLWIAAALTLGAAALASYGLYRYGLVTMGLLDEPEVTDTQ